ncbi:MAG: sugar phosphate isomerase/epimerase, partial [Planctomycetes bacterium]|nr:sugar phosphate isomerase/epimerase [Planctomycetota bacterium]
MSTSIAAGVATIGRTRLARGEIAEAGLAASTVAGKGRIYKAVKWGMIEGPGSVLEKFQLQKEIGYDGMELISPSELNPVEVRRASDQSGMPVHGVVDMNHWEIRLSSPDAAQREQGVAILEQALRDARVFGGDS